MINSKACVNCELVGRDACSHNQHRSQSPIRPSGYATVKLPKYKDGQTSIVNASDALAGVQSAKTTQETKQQVTNRIITQNTKDFVATCDCGSKIRVSQVKKGTPVFAIYLLTQHLNSCTKHPEFKESFYTLCGDSISRKSKVPRHESTCQQEVCKKSHEARLARKKQKAEETAS